MDAILPKITIVTVVFNGRKDIEETILSVINQDYINVEYIVIDGGSTDGTLDIIEAYSERIFYWITEPDTGIYDAMNKGIDFSSGDFILFLNCGDRLCIDSTITQVVSNIGENWSKYDIIYGNIIFMYPFASFLAKPLSIELITQKFPIYHPASFTKSSLLKHLKFDTTFYICADYNLFYNLYKNNSVFKYVDSAFVVFSAETGVSSTQTVQRIKEECLITGRKFNKLSTVIYEYYMMLILLLRSIFPTSMLNRRRIRRLIKHYNWKLIYVDKK